MTTATVTVQGVQCTLADTATSARYGPYICTIACASGTPMPVFASTTVGGVTAFAARAIPIDVLSTNPITVTSTTPGNAANVAAGYLAALTTTSGSMAWEFVRASLAGAILQAWNNAGGAQL